MEIEIKAIPSVQPKSNLHQNLHCVGLLLLFVIPVIFSCAGLGDRYLESLSPAQAEELKRLDLALLDYRFSPDARLLAGIEVRCKAILEGTLPNREFKAEVLGIMGTALFYKNDSANAARTAALIDRESQAEPRLYTLRALIVSDRAKKIALLTDGLTRVARKGLIQLALAELWSEGGEYRKALAAYDEAFTSLNPRYRESYKKNRDLAFQLMDKPLVSMETKEILSKNELAVADVLTVTLRESRFLDVFSADKNLSVSILYVLLGNKGYFRDAGPLVTETMTRKDIAFFLLRLVAGLDNDPKLLDRYTGAASSLAPSPVPDVLSTDPWYNAALILVEREIMDLPDGKRFFPERSMSGGQYYDILKKLKSLYR
jgi:tetratricopeptide (TPR) repeat protein